jgi:hypothetical protein
MKYTIAIAALLAATPAGAQYYQPHNYVEVPKYHYAPPTNLFDRSNRFGNGATPYGNGNGTGSNLFDRSNRFGNGATPYGQ